MNILVTGGAGFIGSNIVNRYIDEGHNVIIIDDLSTGKKRNINPKAIFYDLDILSEKVSGIFEKHDIDIVNHHAAQIDVRSSVKDPLNDAKINIVGLLNLLENSIKYDVKKFIAVSSGGVIYGTDAKLPISEDEYKQPISPYGISKLTSEYYLNYYNIIHGLPYTVFRYSNVYGTNQDPHGEAGVIAIFSKILLDNKTPIIYGNGTQTRDYVYVKDVVEANVKALTDGNNEEFNIGTSIETSVLDLLKMLQNIIGNENSATFEPARKGEVNRNCLSIKKAKEKLNWEPSLSLFEGLAETVKWVKKVKNES